MPVATRLLVAFLLLIGAFVVLVGIAVFSLYTAGQMMLAGVVATAGLVGLAAGGVTFWFLRREADDEDELEVEPVVLLPMPAPVSAPPRVAVQVGRRAARRGPLRVQSMPVADLPPAYVDAVLRGAQARLTALRSQSLQQHPPGE